MKIGTRLHAPDGCAYFPKNQEFYLLASTPDPCRVLLVHFAIKTGSHGQTPRRALLMQLPREDFETHCIRKLIQPTAEQSEHPSWVELHGSVYTYLDRPAAVRLVERRWRQVLTAVSRWEEILRAPNPEHRLSEIARSIHTNESRYRIFVLSFMVFGQNPAVLAPLYCNSGRWDRYEGGEGRKLGRPSLAHGKNHGSRLDAEQLVRIDAAYLKYRSLGKTFSSIYEDAVRLDWRCKCLEEGNFATLIQPNGLPFPTFRQFHYRIERTLGLRQIQLDRYGAEIVRNRLTGNKGSYAAECANLMERVEFDAFTVNALPVGVDGSLLPALYVVRAKEGTSGMFIGVGFSLGSEKATAYSMALFSMSVPKVRFCAFFGIKIDEADWPCEGLSSKAIFDRGPGESLKDVAAIRELAPSYSGQAKASIETSHPKDDHLEGAPSFVSSGKTPVELAVAVIYQTIAANKSTNMVGRLSPRMKIDCELATPLEIWNYLDQRGRNVAVRVPFDKAVRDRLEKREVICTADGVTYKDNLFTSTEFTDTGLTAKAKAQRFTLNAYFMSCCARQTLVEYRGRFLELQLTLPFADDDSQRNLTLTELEILGERGALLGSRMRSAKPAIRVGIADKHYENFGTELDASKRKPGRPKPRKIRAKRDDIALYTLGS